MMGYILFVDLEAGICAIECDNVESIGEDPEDE